MGEVFPTVTALTNIINEQHYHQEKQNINHIRGHITVQPSAMTKSTADKKGYAWTLLHERK